MDRSVKPGDDFWAYVNGTWAKNTEIAPDRTYVGIDSVLNDQIDRDVRAIVEDMAADPSKSGKIGQQVGGLYASWMDEAGIEARGTAPLAPYLAQIAAVKDRGDLIDLFATPGFESPVAMTIMADLKHPDRYSLYAFQDGLGLPNRDYYLLQGAKYDEYRAAYRNYVIELQKLAGIAAVVTIISMSLIWFAIASSVFACSSLVCSRAYPPAVWAESLTTSLCTNVAPRLSTCSRAAGRTSKPETTAPSRRAVAMA